MFLGPRHRKRQVFVVIACAETELGRELVRLRGGHRAAKPMVVTVDWPEIERLGSAVSRDVYPRRQPFRMPRDPQLDPLTLWRIDDLKKAVRETR